MERLNKIENTFNKDQINPSKKEWEIERMRASGPGGQNVQKTESRVRVRWNFEVSKDISEEEKNKLRERFPDGYIEAISQKTRSQIKNIKIAKSKINEIKEEVLRPKKERIPTLPTPFSKERRLEQKRRISEKKKLRKRVEF
jgi:ribosome-associated protein